MVVAASTLISPIAPKRHGSSVGADLIQPDLQSVGVVGTVSGYTLPFRAGLQGSELYELDRAVAEVSRCGNPSEGSLSCRSARARPGRILFWA